MTIASVKSETKSVPLALLNRTEGRRIEVTGTYMAEQPKVNYCPHGYGECEQGCCYPGRCGRFAAF